jgi:regulator of cell morphogenesis and NO signaling
MQVLEISDKQKKVLTVREIASQDVRNAEVLKRLGIEICCGGIMTLEAACLHLKLDLVEVEKELIKARNDETTLTYIHLHDFNAADLTNYLYNKYHVSFYKENNLILDLLNRVQSHVKQYPVLAEVNRLYLELQKSLINDFGHKENLLFSKIRKGDQLERSSPGEVPADVTGMLENLKDVELIGASGQSTAAMLENLRKVTGNFIAPQIACNSFKLLYHKLKHVEEDLLAYMEVEQHILYPKVVLLCAKLQRRI